MLHLNFVMLGWSFLVFGLVATIACTVFHWLLLAEVRGIGTFHRMSMHLNVQSWFTPDSLNLSEEGRRYLRFRLISLMIAVFCFPGGVMLTHPLP